MPINLSAYINFWKSLLELGGSGVLLKFIHEISNLYKTVDKSGHLVEIYKCIVSKIIFKALKFSRTAQPQIQDLATFYVNSLFANLPNKE